MQTVRRSPIAPYGPTLELHFGLEKSRETHGWTRRDTERELAEAEWLHSNTVACEPLECTRMLRRIDGFSKCTRILRSRPQCTVPNCQPNQFGGEGPFVCVFDYSSYQSLSLGFVTGSSTMNMNNGRVFHELCKLFVVVRRRPLKTRAGISTFATFAKDARDSQNLSQKPHETLVGKVPRSPSIGLASSRLESLDGLQSRVDVHTRASIIFCQDLKKM